MVRAMRTLARFRFILVTFRCVDTAMTCPQATITPEPERHMHFRGLLALSLVLALSIATSGVHAQGPTSRTKTLDIYYIDVEGGQATLFVSPSGESLLVDTGFPGDRDSGRIMDAVKAAGLTQVDHLVSTHSHLY